VPRGEICLSLRTRHLREAEHRAALLDRGFDDALTRATANVTDAANLNAILRDYLQACLDADLEWRVISPSARTLFGAGSRLPDDDGLQFTAAEHDLDTLSSLIGEAREALAERNARSVAERVDSLMKEHSLPEALRGKLALGVLEVHVHLLEEMRRRCTGEVPLVFDPSAPQSPSAGPIPATGGASAAPPTRPVAPAASTLIEAFGDWGRRSGGWRAGGENQAKVSLVLFLEVCGDKPIDGYSRADGDRFRSALRSLPTTYRKSPKDREKPLKAIIAEADATGAPRIGEKTVKRHFWAVSRFFAFLTETGRLPSDVDNPGRGFSFNTKGSARRQRDMWTGNELRTLFASPVWNGCHPYFRSRPGDRVIRDSLFWLPLLGLYHGNRLEEFAQLRRSDIGQANGIWYLDITDEDGRQLKNEQSRRWVPLHPELIRIGFLDYVAETAKHPRDQVFPDLNPGGKDRKLGYYFSKKFSAYREAVGVRRRGLDYHAFRHGVTTKLYEADVNEGWIDLLTGHESGGESRRRYLKGIPLTQLRAAIERVTWPEVDLSHLYQRTEGDEAWREGAGKTAA
jgi:integrase